jgi:hypothetical protein
VSCLADVSPHLYIAVAIYSIGEVDEVTQYVGHAVFVVVGCGEWCCQWAGAQWLTITILNSFSSVDYFSKFCVF